MNVSVVIPTFNAERFIAQTIRSVLNQSSPAHEIIVVDDGSADGTAEVVRGFGAAVTLIEPGHGGASQARNCGAALTSGDAIMFLDADDVLGPDVLRHLVMVLRDVPHGIALCPWNRLERVDGRWARRPASCTPRVPGDDVLSAWLSGWYHPPCSVLWSRAAYELSGGWDESLPGNPNDDGDIMMRALARGAPVLVAARGTAFYRKHDAPTLSGRRFTEEGLQARMQVLVKLAGIFQEQRRLTIYGPAIGAAFDLIAADAREHAPALAAECERLARRYGGPQWRRQIRCRERDLRTRAGEIRRLLVDPWGPVRRRRERRNPVEVRYGLGDELDPPERRAARAELSSEIA